MTIFNRVLTLLAATCIGVIFCAEVLSAQAGEGVAVRGHWVIEVRNPDGTLVTRREFDNALQPGGARLLAQYMGRAATAARWTIRMGAYGAASPCNGPTLDGRDIITFCTMEDPATVPLPQENGFFTTLATALGGAATDEVVITGWVTARTAGQVGWVTTLQSTCPSSFSLYDCNASGGVPFTSHDLVDGAGVRSPVAVVPGQIVQVTVNLSFF